MRAVAAAFAPLILPLAGGPPSPRSLGLTRSPIVSIPLLTVVVVSLALPVWAVPVFPQASSAPTDAGNESGTFRGQD